MKGGKGRNAAGIGASRSARGVLTVPRRRRSVGEALNIVAAIVLVAVNTCISFFLSPYIVATLGVEANGYITLANNFVSYMGLITAALESMAGMFIILDYHKGRIDSANRFYTSVLFGDFFLGAALLVFCVFFLSDLQAFISISDELLLDIRLLFALTFASFFLVLFLPKWDCATYATNKLYLRSVKNAIVAIVRAAGIYLAFLLFKPAVWFVAAAALLATAVGLVISFGLKHRLTPQFRIDPRDFEMAKVRKLLSSGIWNSVTKCGNVLLDGLDLFIANIFVGATPMGVLSLAKTVPSMVTQVTGNVGVTFGPGMAELFAKERYSELKNEMLHNVRILALLATILVGVTFALGESFFALWVPSQDAHELAMLANLALVGVLVTSLTSGLTNIFGLANRLRANSLVVIASGLVSIGTVLVLLNVTDLGVFAIAGTSSVVALLRELGFTAPYAARCIGQPLNAFHGELLKCMALTVVPFVVAFGVMQVVPTDIWLGFFVAVALSAIASFVLLMLLMLDWRERADLIGHLKRRLWK